MFYGEDIGSGFILALPPEIVQSMYLFQLMLLYDELLQEQRCHTAGLQKVAPGCCIPHRYSILESSTNETLNYL